MTRLGGRGGAGLRAGLPTLELAFEAKELRLVHDEGLSNKLAFQTPVVDELAQPFGRAPCQLTRLDQGQQPVSLHGFKSTTNPLGLSHATVLSCWYVQRERRGFGTYLVRHGGRQWGAYDPRSRSGGYTASKDKPGQELRPAARHPSHRGPPGALAAVTQSNTPVESDK